MANRSKKPFDIHEWLNTLGVFSPQDLCDERLYATAVRAGSPHNRVAWSRSQSPFTCQITTRLAWT